METKVAYLIRMGTNQHPLTKPSRLLLMAIMAISVVGMATYLTRAIVEQRIRADATDLLATHQQSISNTVERLRHLPVSAALNNDIINLLEAKLDYNAQAPVEAAKNVNQYLATIANSAGASIYYLLDVYGNAVASSNWQDNDSLVGNSYSFRPYYYDAMKGNDARYMAIGTTTKEAGYFFASPVVGKSGLVGVAVVKTELESLQQQWRETGDNLIMFDENGISVLASNENWRFRTLTSTSPNNLPVLRNELKYAGKQLRPLTRNSNHDEDEIRLNGVNYLVIRATLAQQDWQLWQLTTKESLATATWLAVIASLLLLSLSAALILYRIEKGRKNLLSAEAKEANKMRKLNQQLEAEIAEREKAELELNAAQAELIEASKLAALGQMSAAIVHEVNQPLAAIKTFGASAKLLIQRNQIEAASKNLDEIKNLTERLATITSDLKIFAGRTNEHGDPTCLQDSIVKVLKLLQQLLQDANVIVYQELPEESVYVMGSAVRIEQVITNLLSNAVDATESVTNNKQIKIHLFIDQKEVVLRISDNGTGLDTHTLQHLFDPFFTTKPIGEGVGLGLAISYGIVKEMGGTLKVRNNDDGGALFSLRLNQAKPNFNAPSQASN